ncbi:thrombospondin type 3 repeat-containing protein [Gallibacterium anatis]|uniref:thrombospondin type 3 repeat-containing protein n=1 Tax=Gallibacterium anatis TaxID=750 RepID=UPI00254D191E|nr:thrombospondin type 3 repeat-containing protein [Gallibacterium anatis]MDK9561176.1 thrombospondin type 3 repeat-containing protein [Gallibacterium anatis]
MGGDKSGYSLTENDITNGKVSFTVPVTDGFTGKLVVQGVKVQDAEKQSSATADRKEAALDLGADPTVDMSFRSDTGISGSDNITTNGELVLAAPQGYTIDRVEVNNVEESLIGSSITLSEGSYAPGSIQVTVRNTTTGRIETVSNTTTYVVDTTAPDAPRINVESGRDSSISLPENAAIGDVVDVNITQPGKQQAIYVQYRKTDSSWEVATFQPADSGLSSAPAVSGNTITISQTVAPAGSTIAAKVTDLAGNGSAGKDGGNSFVEAEVPSSDSDNDGYTDDEEVKAGSDPNQKASTPKTLADSLYEKAKQAFDDFNAKKTEFATNGFTKNEVDELSKMWQPLSSLKQEAINAAELVHETDGRQALIDDITALSAEVPERNNEPGDAYWTSRSSQPNLAMQQMGPYYGFLRSGKTLNDYASENGGIVKIAAQDLAVTDSFGGQTFATKLAATSDAWIKGFNNGGGVSITEYRVDKDGNMEIRIDAEAAKKVDGTINQTFKVFAEDGTELTLNVPFKNPDTEGNGVKILDVTIYDNKQPLTGAVEKNGITNDGQWSDIKVQVNKQARSGSNLDSWRVKLEIIDTTDSNRVVWNQEQTVGGTGKAVMGFNANGFNPIDGHTYILRASSYDINNKTVLGTYTISDSVENRVTLDTTPPAVEHLIYADEAGKLHVQFTFKEDSLKVWRKDGALENPQTDVLQNYSSAVDVSQKDHKWSTTIRDGESTFVFYDKEGNSQIVDLLKDAKVLRLARLTTNMNKDGGPRNFDSDGNEEQNKDYGSNGLKTASDKDNIIILRQKQGGNGFGGFIDGGTDLPEYKATLQTYDRNDLIDAVGMGGHTDVITRGGDDTLILRKGMSGYGPAGYPGGSFDGPQRILMGAGNDTFSIFGVFKDSYGMNNTTAKVSMGDDDDTISITRSIEADHDSERPYSNYFSLGAGNDKMTVGGTITDTAPKLASNIIDLGSGNDVLTVGGELQDDVLILSKDSSTITVGGIGGQANVTMLLGAGDDTVTVRNSVNYSEARDKAIFKEIYNASLKYTGDYQDDVRSWYEESKDALAKLPDNNYIINLGEGNNTMSVGGNMIHAKIESGSGKDTVTINTWVLSSNNIKLGAGDDSISINSMFKDDSISGQSLIYGGEGRDTINLGTPNSDSNKVRLEMYGDIGGNNIDVSSIEVFNLNGKGGTLIIGNKGDIVSGKASTIGPIEVHGTNADSVRIESSWHKVATDNGAKKYEYKNTGIYISIDDAINVTEFSV